MVDYAFADLEGVETHPPPLVGEFYQKAIRAIFGAASLAYFLTALWQSLITRVCYPQPLSKFLNPFWTRSGQPSHGILTHYIRCFSSIGIIYTPPPL